MGGLPRGTKGAAGVDGWETSRGHSAVWPTPVADLTTHQPESLMAPELRQSGRFPVGLCVRSRWTQFEPRTPAQRSDEPAYEGRDTT
jgi:hypothetical protein